MAWIVLALALAAFLYFFKGDFGGVRALSRERPPGWRRRRYRLWIAKACLLFGGTSILGLTLLERLPTLTTSPSEFLPLAVQAGYPIALESLALELAVGLAVGTVIGAAWAWQRGRRGKRPAMLGDFSALLPEDRGEAWLAAASALTAGITEELYFRLLVPLTVAIATGSAIAGFVAGTILFGVAHRYQRWPGMIATTLVGILFAFVYLQSGQLWLAMLVHAGIDLNGLVLRPMLAVRAGRSRKVIDITNTPPA